MSGIIYLHPNSNIRNELNQKLFEMNRAIMDNQLQQYVHGMGDIGLQYVSPSSEEAMRDINNMIKEGLLSESDALILKTSVTSAEDIWRKMENRIDDIVNEAISLDEYMGQLSHKERTELEIPADERKEPLL